MYHKTPKKYTKRRKEKKNYRETRFPWFPDKRKEGKKFINLSIQQKIDSRKKLQSFLASQ